VASASELRVDPVLRRLEPLLLEAGDRGPRERLVDEVGERRPAPEVERRLEGRRRPRRVAARELVLPLGREAFEPLGVELLRAERQDVAGRAVRDRAVPAERPPEAGDVALERVRRRLGRMLGPQLVDQPVGRDDAVRLQREQHEEGTLLRAAE
jgi:hypothetical protein